MPIYRKMTLRERIFGREPDTAEVVVYKNYTLKEWFWGRQEPHILTAIQRSVGVLGIVIVLTLMTLYICGIIR